jgi:hypothetical protein
MGIADRVSAAQQQIQAQTQSQETATARHTVYWRPSDLDTVREFSAQHFVSMADAIRGAVRYALAHEDDFLESLRAERIRKLDGQTKSR